MSRIAELQQRIDAFGRPPMRFDGIGAAHASLAAARQWDVCNPVDAAARARLIEELERETMRSEREDAEARATERAMRTMGSKLARSGVGERSLAAAADADDTEALGVVKRWLPDASLTFLVLCGAKGTGKSVAATWAVREAIRRGDTGAFRRVSELAKLSQFDAGAAELEYLKGVHLLVLDDFGTELLGDYARAQLHELLDHRHETYGRTVITSNLPWLATTRNGQTVPGLADRLGERLVDRLDSAGRKVQLAAAPSMRRRAS